MVSIVKKKIKTKDQNFILTLHKFVTSFKCSGVIFSHWISIRFKWILINRKIKIQIYNASFLAHYLRDQNEIRLINTFPAICLSLFKPYEIHEQSKKNSCNNFYRVSNCWMRTQEPATANYCTENILEDVLSLTLRWISNGGVNHVVVRIKNSYRKEFIVLWRSLKQRPHQRCIFNLTPHRCGCRSFARLICEQTHKK